MDAIIDHYAGYDEEARLDSQNSGKVEFLTTMRYIEKYLRPGHRALDIGAGTGRYSRALADMGCEVEAVELVPGNVEIFKKTLKPGQRASVTQGNALDLSMFEEDRFDATLLMGPLYHLFTPEDKRRAISEAIRATKRGGVIFAAYCISDGSIIDVGFQRKLYDIADNIRQGKIDPDTFATHSEPRDVFEMTRKEDIDRLMEGFAVERLHYVATDMLTKMMRGTVNAMDGETFDLYLRYHYACCEREDMVGATHHSLDIFRKT